MSFPGAQERERENEESYGYVGSLWCSIGPLSSLLLTQGLNVSVELEVVVETCRWVIVPGEQM